MIVLLRKYNKTFVAPTKYTVSLNIEIEYPKTKFIILNKNTHNVKAKTDKNLLKSGFYMKLTDIWLLEVPFIKNIKVFAYF